MASGNTTLITNRGVRGNARRPTPVPVLVVVWSASEPARLGEVLIPPQGETSHFGRDEGDGTIGFERQRPGANVAAGHPATQRISRTQLRIQAQWDRLAIENVGRRALFLNGEPVTAAVARCGDLVEIGHELLFLVVERPPVLPAQRLPAGLVPPFGEPDEFGFVGESLAAWDMRRQIAFAGGRDDHTLVTGASGTGKELAAHAIHALSRRGRNPLVSRNAVTLPDGLVDAELFGNVRDYPNAGMPERPGLAGAADGSTLFLDEIGELSHTLQAHLLRLIDAGEYHRLGEVRSRRIDMRFIAATNRDPTSLKHDLLARLRLRVQLPGLEKRREDIPLIARHLLRTLAQGDALVAERAFPDGDPTGEPRWDAELVAELVTASHLTNVRDVQRLLWESIAHGSEGGLASPAPAAAESADGEADPSALTKAQVLAALDAARGNRDRTWRALGLRSRHQLLRVMRRMGIQDGATRS
jgi:hypothetical protein